jgi:23S rRNA (adenine2503-C2)-methyltransferase
MSDSIGAPLFLFGARPPDVETWLAAQGAPCTAHEARRVTAHFVSEGKSNPTAMKKPINAKSRNMLLALGQWARPRVVERALDSDDGFVKYLFELSDGARVEAVRIPLHKPGAFTICLSSQVGCAMGCTFCATGRLGLSRHLLAHEMVGQLVAIRDELAAHERITGAVFMGQGEPLHNYDEVIKAAYVLSDPCGGRVDARNISISTVGLVPAMHRYAQEKHPFRLVVSVHSAVEEKRKQLLPIAKKHNLAELAEAVAALHASNGDRVTIAWCLMQGVNHGDDEVAALKQFIGDVPIRLNLIDVNDARPVEEGGFRPVSPVELKRFLDAAQVLRQPIVRRYSGGKNKHGACGMLATKSMADAEVPTPS